MGKYTMDDKFDKRLEAGYLQYCELCEEEKLEPISELEWVVKHRKLYKLDLTLPKGMGSQRALKNVEKDVIQEEPKNYVEDLSDIINNSVASLDDTKLLNVINTLNNAIFVEKPMNIVSTNLTILRNNLKVRMSQQPIDNILAFKGMVEREVGRQKVTEFKTDVTDTLPIQEEATQEATKEVKVTQAVEKTPKEDVWISMETAMDILGVQKPTIQLYVRKNKIAQNSDNELSRKDIMARLEPTRGKKKGRKPLAVTLDRDNCQEYITRKEASDILEVQSNTINAYIQRGILGTNPQGLVCKADVQTRLDLMSQSGHYKAVAKQRKIKEDLVNPDDLDKKVKAPTSDKLDKDTIFEEVLKSMDKVQLMEHYQRVKKMLDIVDLEPMSNCKTVKVGEVSVTTPISVLPAKVSKAYDKLGKRKRKFVNHLILMESYR